MLWIYSLSWCVVLIVGAPWWLFRMATSGKYREGLSERLGAVPRRILGKSPAVWVHAVSVGEVLAASRLIEELRANARGWRVVVSTTTRTGQRLAKQKFGAEHVFYFPLDFAWIVRSYLRALRPRMLVLLETEFWPNVLTEFRKARIPVAVVNARISDRSLPRYMFLRLLWRRILGGLQLVLAQTETDVERLRAIGAPPDRVRLGGNLKFDVRAAKGGPLTKALEKYFPADTRMLVCGSTLEGEESLLLAAWPELTRAVPVLAMALAPRHPERFEAVAALLNASGLRWVRRSAWMKAPQPLSPGTILLLDTIGELASVYSLASVAFVGGSLVPAGGHNPLEPAQFAVPIVMGPSCENFRAIVDRLRAENAIRIVEPRSLVAEILSILRDDEEAAALGQRASRVFESEAGATARAVAALLQILSSRDRK
jgi:3-deoxy-D-manno-octulosonic-acid transferase